jgi:methyl-accepting chemotaxis protein
MLQQKLNDLLTQFGTMTVGVTDGYDEVARAIVDLSEVLNSNAESLDALADLLPQVQASLDAVTAATTIALQSPALHTPPGAGIGSGDACCCW